MQETLCGGAPPMAAGPLQLQPLRKRLIRGVGPLLVGLASFALVASDLGLERYGVPADEAFYHAAARRHVTWLSTLGAQGSFSAQTLDAYFAWRP